MASIGALTNAAAINAKGHAVGWFYLYDTSGSPTHAFIYSSTFTDLGTLGGTYRFAYGINDSGQVTGGSYIMGNAECGPGGCYHAFVYSDGLMNDMGTLGSYSTEGVGINASGQVTGYSYTVGATHMRF